MDRQETGHADACFPGKAIHRRVHEQTRHGQDDQYTDHFMRHTLGQLLQTVALFLVSHLLLAHEFVFLSFFTTLDNGFFEHIFVVDFIVEIQLIGRVSVSEDDIIHFRLESVYFFSLVVRIIFVYLKTLVVDVVLFAAAVPEDLLVGADCSAEKPVELQQQGGRERQVGEQARHDCECAANAAGA